MAQKFRHKQKDKELSQKNPLSQAKTAPLFLFVFNLYKNNN